MGKTARPKGDEERATPPYWARVAGSMGSEPLSADAAADVCVVGAGIAGMSAAYVLSRTRRVIVLERGTLGCGETGRTTAHLTAVLDARYQELERTVGADGARLARESHATAIDCIERFALQEGIDCGFERVDGYLVAHDAEAAGGLEQELTAARGAGLADARLLPRAPGLGSESAACLHVPRQAQLHPLRYLRGLAAAVRARGGVLHGGTHVTELEDGSRLRVATERGPVVSAGAVVVATNTPVHARLSLHTKQAPYRTYVIAARVPRGSVPRALYWDTDDPYRYVRVADHSAAEDVVLVGGEDHKTGQETDGAERWRRLERWARERLPALGSVEQRWSGQVQEPVDALGFIGRHPGGSGNVYVVSGHSGNGMTYGAVAGMLLSGLIEHGEHPWAKLYDPARKPLRAGLEFARENLNVAAQYADWVKGGEVDSEEAVAPGQGAVLRRGAARVALYRDDRGVLHERSAVCPHLQCVVRWNPAEQSWDCPCHGSRFDAMGGVLIGPANADLGPAARKEADGG